MLELKQRHIAVGGNRHTAAADWKEGIFAFGGGKNVAVWRPEQHSSVTTLLRGHTDQVSAVRIFSRAGQPPVLISGSADKTVRVWTEDKGASEGAAYEETFQGQHEGAVNAIAVLPEADLVITGAADATLKIWKLQSETQATAEASATLLQTIALKPRFLPLALAACALDDGSIVLAVAGTTTSIQIYHGLVGEFKLAATLTGHEGWTRSLDFVRESPSEGSDFLLASASQDKYVRLWRVHKGSQLPTASAASQDPSLGAVGRSLSNKPHFIGSGATIHSITFEALLIGHEDWIYTALWKAPTAESGAQLLTTSADNSVSIWKREEDSGFWICQTRLGEISAQKGSTTATGSVGGFWIGLWSPDGKTIASLGRTGSWRVWSWQSSSDSWEQQIGISGHTKEVMSISWSTDGSYLLSTGSDQTTRLLAPWRRDAEESWHEIARPQIHGYDLNCIGSLGTKGFVSGADEKLLRVFNKPRSTAVLLGKLGGALDTQLDSLPEIANIPVLGLSNKAMTADDTEDGAADKTTDEAEQAKETVESDHPPFEDALSRYTLWPEHEKLYGHGYEISTMAVSHDGKLVATACRASSIDHAVIRLYETTDWREVKPALSSHSLTVTSLAFSPDDKQLLSVGRDRQWTVFSRTNDDLTYKMASVNPKGHSRMILDCAWVTSDIFATAGRDKAVKLWAKDDETYTCRQTIPLASAVTAVAALPVANDGRAVLAAGSDEGEVQIVSVQLQDFVIGANTSLAQSLRPAGPVTALRWRPTAEIRTLAVSSEDHSVRIYELDEVQV